MTMWNRSRSWLRATLHRLSTEREMDAELRFHIEAYTDDLVRSGIPHEEARRRARIEFGGVERAKEECRDATGANLFGSFLQDIRYGLRMLRKSPGFTAVAILALALGIGANTAIFSVVEGVVLAPLPYRHADRLVMILESNLRFPKDAISYPNFQDWRRTAHSFEQMSAIMVQQGFDLTAPGAPEHIVGNRITSGFFSTLGVNLALGREFSLQEDHRAGPPVTIISNRLWRDRFASSPQVVGEPVILDGVDYTIIGVTPPGFHPFSGDVDIYAPLGQGDPLILNARATHDSMISIARLKPGVSISQAQAEMTTVQAQLDQLYADADAGLGVDVLPLKSEIVGDASATLFLLLIAVGLVLLIACANVANLFLARSAARTSEFAIRSALGASGSRIVRQLVTESVLLSFAGGIVGLIFATLGAKLVSSALPLNLPRTENIHVNAFVLLFALGISVVVGILFGLAPAMQSSRTNPHAVLKEGGRGSAGAQHRAQSSLVIFQMALTLVLLVGAGLLFRTIRHLWETDPGFNTHQVIAFKVGLSPSITQKGSSLRTGFLQLLERIRSIPGVQSADFTMLVPLSHDDNDTPFWIGSDKPAVLQNAPRMLVFDTGPDYLRTMGIALLRGRFFTPDDTTNSPCVAVIDSVFARTYFPGKDPVGAHLTFGFPVAPWGPCSIIGVVGHVSHWGLGNPGTNTEAQSYYPLYQARDELWPLGYPYMQIVIRTPLDIAAIMPAIKAEVYNAGGDQTVYDLRTMQEIASESMSSQRFPMILLGAFAGLALLLASIGIYGVISYSVTLRGHEIGIRMALGAGKRDIFRMIIGQGLRLALIGLAIGAGTALILTRLLSSFSHLLYGVTTSDPLTFVSVSGALTGIALLACYIPARRAMRIDPMVALRHE
jgi:putative ABC transport system permease protein